MTLLAVYELIEYRKLVTVRILLYLYIYYGLIIYPTFKQDGFESSSWPVLTVMLDIYCFCIFILLCYLFKKRYTFSKIAKYRALCLFYIWTILFSICLTGNFSFIIEGFPWQLFTFLSHLVFIYIFYTTVKRNE